MFEIFKIVEQINDPRQSWKTKHRMVDIIAIVLFAMLGNVIILISSAL